MFFLPFFILRILYIITNMVCVRPSDDVLGAFSVAKPATEIFYGKTGHRDHDHRLPATQVLRPKCSSPHPQNGHNY
jgi:hypothetical protein